MILTTFGDEGVFSFWHNPVLYTKRKSHRKVILVSADTLRADHLGCYGYRRETSANIDALARESVLFERVYASSSWTLPSHVSLLTALHGLNHQVYWVDEKMDPSQITLADTDWLLGRQRLASEGLPLDIRLPASVALGERKNKLIINRGMAEKETRLFHPPPGYSPEELFSLEADEEEKMNLVFQDPDLARRMGLKIKKLYGKGRAVRPDRITITDQLREQLRALGYVR